MRPQTGRHDATAGTYITCGVVLVLAILLVVWAIRGGPFNPVPATPPTPIPVIIVTPVPPPVPTGVPTGVQTAFPPGVVTKEPDIEKRKTRIPPVSPTLPPVRATIPPALPTATATSTPTASVPEPLPSGVPTRTLLNAVAQHDGTVPLFDVPCWSNARRAHPSCTPTPFPPSPTDTAVPTDTPMPTATASSEPTWTAVPQGTPTPCAGPDPYWSCVSPEQFEAEVARLINAHRQSPPHDPWYESGITLDLRADLSTAERLHAQEMVATDQCIHGDFGTRAIEQGYTGWAWGNIGACGYPNPAEAVQGWVDSPAHHWIMDEANAMTEFGVGMAFYENRYASVWVTIGCGGGIPCMAATTGHP